MLRVLRHATLALAAAFAAMALAAPAAAQEAAGNWRGDLEPVPGTRLPLVVHLARNDAGGLSGTMDSPAQDVRGLPLGDVTVTDGKLSFTVPSIGGSYTGQWDADTRSWKGEWRQAGQHWPLTFATPAPSQPLPTDWQLPTDDGIGALIAARNAPRAGQGIVVGVLEGDKRRYSAGGTGAAVDRDTLFEIGSISKVFTALILADMANRGEVSLDDPAQKYLPQGHKMPAVGGRPITLRDLSTHRSGLPRMPDNIGAMNAPEGPFAGYDEAKLLAYLDRAVPERGPGEKWEYSNLGVGLLGYLLSRAAGSDYETLLRERITGPLGMNDTMITLPPSHASRLVPALDAYMRPTPPWDIGVLIAAGGIRSSASDMLTFAKAALDPRSPIADAMRTALSVREPALSPRAEQALGWVALHPQPGREILLHDGGTGGFRTAIALDPAKRRAVTVLVNSAAEPGAADLALHLLLGSPVDATPPVAAAPPPAVTRTTIAMPAEELEKFVGRYDFGPGFVIAITFDGRTLRAQRDGIPGAPALPILPEGPRAFFWKDVDAQIGFIADDAGRITGAAFTQGELALTGKRLDP